MPYNPEIYRRRSIRLQGYDYSQAGLYFITICVQNRACLFGNISDEEMILNDAGWMIEMEWLDLKKRFPNIELHEYVVMPNHFHGILEITVGATLVVAQNNMVAQNNNIISKNVGDMMDAFKSVTTVEYIRGVKTLNWQPFDKKLWQRNYYEHIIRDADDYACIAGYIISNPAKWLDDTFYNK